MNYLIGDSQAEGLAPSFLTRGWRVVHRRGYSTRRLRDEVLPNVPFGAGDTVVLVTGGNDDPGSAELPEVVRSTVALVTRRGAKLVWVGPVFARVLPDATVHPRTAEIHRSNVQGKPGVTWIDAQALTRDLARSTSVHLDVAGYRTYAARLEAALHSSSSSNASLVWFGAAAAAVVYFARRGMYR
jgi:hypothetical protein